MMDNSQQLINILFDQSAREDERDDAAIDLRKYPSQKALDALIKITSNPNEDFFILDSSIESIGEIFIKLNYFDEESFRKMIPEAQKSVFNIIMTRNPKLISQTLKDEFM
jgi:hypothetical protein